MNQKVFVGVAFGVVAIVALGIVLRSEYVLAPTTVPENPLVVATSSTTTATTSATIPDPTPVVIKNPDSTLPQQVPFDTPFTLAQGSRVTLAGGLTITLTRIDDSRCKPGVQCIWAGELAPTLTLTGGELGTTTTTIELGTVRTKFLATQYYSFDLGDATATTIKLTVHTIIPSPAPAVTGIVSGTITIGPICPVVREGEVCDPPPEMFTSRNILVYEATDMTVVTRTALSPTGTYKLTLPPGTYFLQIEPAGIGTGEKKPVTVVTGKSAVVDFNIDTGIR